MPQLRFSLQKLMLAVGIVAILVWFVWVPLPAIYRNRVAYHDEQLKHYGLWCLHKDLEVRGVRTKLVVYHSAMKLKYERAAIRPWLPIGLDPPEPR